jgi:hypothetical protein
MQKKTNEEKTKFLVPKKGTATDDDGKADRVCTLLIIKRGFFGCKLSRECAFACWLTILSVPICVGKWN